MSKRALGAVAVTFVVLACTTPQVSENTRSACVNGYDDDGDGRVDCADDECREAGFCEASLEACTNDADDDGNGLVDCEDRGCIDGGFCEPRDVACTVDPQSGCPRGLICSADGNETTGKHCMLPGTTEIDRECKGPGTCRPGLHCFGVCRRICQNELDCPRETFCVRNARTKFGTCSIACVPALRGSGCPSGDCIPPHAFEVGFDEFDLAGICADPIQWKGRVQEGEQCDDPPSITKLGGMCAPGLVCFPEPNGTPRCRTTCGITQEGHVLLACANPAHTCALAYPLDQRPVLESQLLMGICAP
ncbi:MAG: hypothetical protein QM702_21145 [Rubrivivax sp.]